ncbi:TraB/GumN family protein [Treponema sp.]|uniref:TraB/GumN family protein n=1 Tax=Treponema sp. TaxID=166 RepID=UPI0025E98CCE|nr:TraB/GumN family protein [Treponema sp.]MCR5218126.1 TraB/GumN family protein [Treponema sp.]
MKFRIFKSFLIPLFFVLASCASVPVSQKACVTKTDQRLFWRIDGVDKKGKPSVIYIQGTIHVGDERLTSVSDEVLEAFTLSDRIVAEVSSRDFIKTGFYAVRLAMPNKDGKIVTDYLNEEQKATLDYYLKDDSAYNGLIQMNPMMVENYLTIKFAEESGLKSEDGLDMVFYKMAKRRGKPVEGLDALETQMNLLAYGDYDFQINYLRHSLDQLKEAKEKNINPMLELYELYLADDIENLNLLLEEEDEDDQKLPEEFDNFKNKITLERNQEWVGDIKKYLNEGGTTFIFTGCAHWLGKDSVFELLRQDGVIY